MTLSSLIERLEKATGPSRELDGEILLAIGHDQAKFLRWVGMQPKGDKSATLQKFALRFAPSFTSSLDSAMTLVMEGYSFELTYSAAGEGAMRRARLWDWRRGPKMFDPTNEWEAVAKTLPLALIIAALKSRLSDVTREG